jgi:flagellar transcriptional activator FlhD
MAWRVGRCLHDEAPVAVFKSSTPPIQAPSGFADDGVNPNCIHSGNEAPEDPKMKNSHLLDEIREANMTYLILAQRMVRDDREEALYRLGVSEQVAEILADLTPGQMMKIATTNTLVCRFRFDDQMIWNLLTSHTKDIAAQSVAGVHAAILMSTHMAEAA